MGAPSLPPSLPPAPRAAGGPFAWSASACADGAADVRRAAKDGWPDQLSFAALAASAACGCYLPFLDVSALGPEALKTERSRRRRTARCAPTDKTDSQAVPRYAVRHPACVRVRVRVSVCARARIRASVLAHACLSAGVCVSMRARVRAGERVPLPLPLPRCLSARDRL